MGAKRIRTAGAIAAIVLVALVIFTVIVVVVQGHRTPTGKPYFVALGSSFAAGAGLGRLEPGSPLLCARSINGYPQQLARQRHWPIVDMSCGGAVTRHLLSGGQFFQGPQIRTITRETRLVTITVGGNDVGYVADLSLTAARHTNSLFGRLVRLFWHGSRSVADRRFDALYTDLLATIQAVHQRAPDARIVVATYPAIVPRLGTCARLGLTKEEARDLRNVGDRLAAVTRMAARRGGAILVDMHTLGAAHDACSTAPWTKGWTNGAIAPFHPTLLGTRATANAISRIIDSSAGLSLRP